ncbi:hypothetical protein GHN92_20085 [Pseudomonas sp. FSL R10-2964]|uniref:pilus assembly protein TadG-related protein n=1 Tax=Pseudomonas sp. FSL R10-2964 TaxID=2662202 RepID=UPI0012950937|nr:pilus assembly protein TadG-related protein [Pseudomonas sp. FSL R10-2964]MQT86858.1 hypothetical protein [Pseudomonas sp. FSL R10-2964]
MSPQLRGMGFYGPRQQHGAIGLMAAVTLGMVLLFMLLVVDSGRLYLEQRKLQRVADMAVLEAVSRGGNCAGASTAAGFANQSATRNSFTPGSVQKVNTTCGTLSTNSSQLRVFTADATKSDAIRVIATTTVPTSVAGGLWSMFSKNGFNLNTNLTASAVGSNGGAPLAQLTIRNTTLTVDSSKSKILSSLFGGLLGGNVSIDAAGWNGLINTKVNLLSYMNQLKTDLNLSTGGYDEVLKSNIEVGKLIQSTINLLDPNNTLSTTTTIASLRALKLAAGTTTVVLGKILNIQSGTSNSALNIDMNLFDLISGYVQLANKTNGLTAAFPIDLGITKITARIQVLEPPQLSAIGNPALAVLETKTGPHSIYVKTAQIRTVVSVELPALSTVQKILDAVSSLSSALVGTLRNLLNLNIVGTLESLSCALGAKCTSPSLQLLSNTIDIYIDAPSAESYVSAYSCASETTKTLTATTNTSLINIKLGIIDKTQAFPGSTTNPQPLTVVPLPVIDIGTISCGTPLLPLFSPRTCDPRIPSIGGGVGISLDTSVGANLKQPYTYGPANLLPVGQTPLPHTYSTNGIVTSLGNTLNGIKVHIYQPIQNNILGVLMASLDSLLTTLTPILISTINTVLGPVLDRIIDTLLLSLGIDLNQVEVGANLSCNQGGRAQLVL